MLEKTRNNSETHVTLDKRHRTSTYKTKNAIQNTKKDQQHRPHQIKTRDAPMCSRRESCRAAKIKLINSY
jgi:hypothetical protein